FTCKSRYGFWRLADRGKQAKANMKSCSLRFSQVFCTETSPTISLAALFTFFLEPDERSSSTVTEWPSSQSRSTRWLPTKPAPPVQSTRNSLSSSGRCMASDFLRTVFSCASLLYVRHRQLGEGILILSRPNS